MTETKLNDPATNIKNDKYSPSLISHNTWKRKNKNKLTCTDCICFHGLHFVSDPLLSFLLDD